MKTGIAVTALVALSSIRPLLDVVSGDVRMLGVLCALQLVLLVVFGLYEDLMDRPLGEAVLGRIGDAEDDAELDRLLVEDRWGRAPSDLKLLGTRRLPGVGGLGDRGPAGRSGRPVVRRERARRLTAPRHRAPMPPGRPALRVGGR